MLTILMGIAAANDARPIRKSCQRGIPLCLFSKLHTGYGHDHAGGELHVDDLIAVANAVLPFD